LWPNLVKDPIEKWFAQCNEKAATKGSFTQYPSNFENIFKKASFFNQCRDEVLGKLSWNSWGSWSSTCGSSHRYKIAQSCNPSFALCRDIQIQQSSRYSSCPSAVKAKFRAVTRKPKTGKIKFDYFDYKVGSIYQNWEGNFDLPEGYWFFHINHATGQTGSTGHARIYKNGKMICNS